MGFSFRREGKVVRTFELPPMPPPKRIPSKLPIHPQMECLFLTRLPSELRNEVYQLVFGTRVEEEEEEKKVVEDDIKDEEWGRGSMDITLQKQMSEEQSQSEKQKETPEPKPEPAHPLSLLLTCRKISQEATILAFCIHNFTIAATAKPLTFFSLKQATSPLSAEQFYSISSLSLDLNKVYAGTYHESANFFANMMLLFPTAKQLEIRIHRGRLANQMAHMPEPEFIPGMVIQNVKQKAVRRYASYWWRNTVSHTVIGKSFSWQSGQKWQVEWPQFTSPAYTEDMEMLNPEEGWQMTGSMDPEAAGRDYGVETCVCGCGAVVWLAALLVQEGGRRVQVSAVHYGHDDAEQLKAMRVKLEPLEECVEPLPVQWINGGEGGIWNADGAYWKGLKKRNGRLPSFLSCIG